MGVEILSQTYINQFNNASTTDWLLGNVGDIQKLELVCDFSVSRDFTESETLTLSEPNKLILNTGEKWKELGFYAGLDFTLRFDIKTSSSNINTHLLRVDSILDDEMIVVNQTGGNFAGWGYNNFPQVIPSVVSESTRVQDVTIFADVQPQGIQVNYAQITNSSSPSGVIASHIDGTVTSLVAEDTQNFIVLNPAVPFTHQLNFKSGLSLLSSTIRYISRRRHIYTYVIELVYMLSPFYDDINNLIDDIAPDEVLGAEALTDIIEIIGFPVYNNPNISIKNNVKQTVQLGNTGWFDENFNQLPNPFTFTPVVYTNSAGTQVSQLDYANETTVTTTISGLANLTNAKFQYGFIWCNINDEGEIVDGVETIPGYKLNNYPYHESQLISTGGNGANLGDVFPVGTYAGPFSGYSRDGVSGIDVKDVSFLLNGTDVEVSLTFVPTTAFTAFMEDLNLQERQYALWVSIGDPAPSTNQTDRVSLKLDFNTMDTYVEPIGPWDGLTIGFLDHPQADTDTPVVCGNELFVEDDLLAKVSFQIDTAVDAATIPVPTAIQFGVLVKNSTTGAVYVLDKNSVDLTQYPDPTQFNYDVSREFKLGNGNSKNWWKVDHDPTNDSGTLKGVLGWYGFKVRWEDWIRRLPTPPQDFYLNTEPQNGLNNDWEHYFSTSGWDLSFFVNIVTQLGTYQNLKSMSVNDYDTNGTITTTLRYYKEDTTVSPPIRGVQVTAGTDPITGDPLGVVLEGEKIWIEIDYASSVAVADWTSQATVDASVYATQCSEVSSGAGQKEFRQLSSVWLPESSNPMTPLPLGTLADVLWVNNQLITVRTRIDSSKLISANRYKITGRIGCK